MPPSANPPTTKVIFCTSGGWAGARVLQALRAATHIEVVAVLLSTRAFRIGQSQMDAFSFARRQFGPRYLAYLMLSTELGSALRRFRGADVKSIARQANIRLIHTDKINAPDTVAQLRALNADVILSAFFNQVIGTEAAQSAKHAALNVHPARLPEYRGVDPVFYGRLRGASTFGVTLHHIAPSLDEGNILAQRDVTINESHSLLAANVALYEAGAALFIDAAAAGQLNVTGTPQTDCGREDHYDSWPDHQDVTSYRQRGHALWRLRDLRDMLRD
jgi:methionyl-tRNA formyltransferase